MKLRSPTAEPVHMALTSGHSFVVGPEPVEVPHRFLAMAAQKGCLPEGVEPPMEPASTDKSKLDMLVEGVRQMMDGGAVDDFTNDGKPKVDKLSELVGFNVSADERDKAWQAVNDDSDD